MKRVFDDDYDIERIIMNINIEARVEVTPGDTLIILDEIQDAPRALELLIRKQSQILRIRYQNIFSIY